MKILDFKYFIKEIPYKNQSFDIKKDIWRVPSQQTFINDIFKEKTLITINRQNLIDCNKNTNEFILKTLMWGYPTKGRGKNIENMLEPKTFEKLTEIIDKYRDQDITVNQMQEDINSIKGLALSTISKFTQFLNTTVRGNQAVVLDIQIIEAIRSNRFEEFKHLKDINYNNAIKFYTHYLKTINDLSIETGAKPDQIEMFLFTFGRNLSPI